VDTSFVLGSSEQSEERSRTYFNCQIYY